MNTAPQLSSLGKYRLIATIGHGGMAHIHLALMAGPAGFNKLLVIKALRDDIGVNGDEFVTMFLDEARLAARLSHPNIVQTYEVGEAQGRYFIAMEYLEGQSLKTVERRLRSPGLPLPVQLRILAEVAKGLHHAHELRGFDGEPLGVVHRDVSPHNVFLTYDGQVKLLDFGIAKASNAMHLTRVGVIKGKAEYIAPEQIRGEHVDRRADVFALGVMLWEALTGRRFAGGPEVPEITKMHNRLTGGEPRVGALAPDLEPALVHICERALALDPEQRHPTALAFAQDLEGFLAESSIYPSAQQLSDLISPHFAKERDQLRRLIDEQMRTALNPSANFDAGTGQLPMVPRSGFASGVWHMPNGHTPTGIDVRTGYHTDSFTPTTLPPGAAEAVVTATKADPLTRPRAPWPAVIGAVLVAVGVGIFFAVRPTGQEGRAAAAVASLEPVAAAPSAVPATPAEDLIHVALRVEPEGAQVQLDGLRIRRLPFSGEFKRGREVHTLEVTAPGYEPHREALIYDRDLDVRVRLARADDQAHQAPHRRATRPQPKPRAPSEPRHASADPAPQPAAQPKSQEVEPGMDFRRLTPARPANPVVLEEDPYR